jgi:hypothetical protein
MWPLFLTGFDPGKNGWRARYCRAEAILAEAWLE